MKSTSGQADRHNNTYSLPKIASIWLAEMAPMAILGWLINPLLAPTIDP
jgi:hypothetical protein